MAIRFGHWKARNYERIYLNDLEGLGHGGKAFVAPRRDGGVTVGFSGDQGSCEARQVLRDIENQLGCQPTWDALLAACEPVRRGARRGASAASFREKAPWEPEKDRWTPADAEELTTEYTTHPIPEPVTLLVDHREPLEMIERLSQATNLVVESSALETGDYLVPDRLVIERKTVTDFVNSIVEEEKRLFFQSDAIAHSGMPAILLIEGDIYGQTRMDLRQIAGALSYLAVIQGVSVIPTMNVAHSASFIARAVRHACFGLGYDLGLRATGPKSAPEAAVYVLQGCHGISHRLAKTILARMGSLQKVAAASEAELLEIEGIGPKKAHSIVETFRAEPVSSTP